MAHEPARENFDSAGLDEILAVLRELEPGGAVPRRQRSGEAAGRSRIRPSWQPGAAAAEHRCGGRTTEAAGSMVSQPSARVVGIRGAGAGFGGGRAVEARGRARERRRQAW
jgi:hypothetical protein